ncbi:kinase-like domain-containing protein [Obelidium mucronatum]|nr:kinase-like domain-containing protein [Obelidium mucronatum]
MLFSQAKSLLWNRSPYLRQNLFSFKKIEQRSVRSAWACPIQSTKSILVSLWLLSAKSFINDAGSCSIECATVNQLSIMSQTTLAAVEEAKGVDTAAEHTTTTATATSTGDSERSDPFGPPPAILFGQPSPPPPSALPVLPSRAQLAIEYALLFGSSIFGTKYLLQGIVGEGGNGVVVAAIDAATATLVSIKMVLKWTAENVEDPHEFSSLCHINEETNSPNVIRLLDCWQDAANFYIVMEFVGEFQRSVVKAPMRIPGRLGGEVEIPYMEGCSDLRTRVVGLLNDVSGNGIIAIPIAKAIFRGCLAGVREVHALGYTHGDLKMGNFLVRPNVGRPSEVVLCDFGCVHLARDQPPCLGTLCMTAPERLPGYMSYLLAAGLPWPANNTRKQDVFALGIILHQLLCSGMMPATMIDVGAGRLDYAQVVQWGFDGSLWLDQAAHIDAGGLRLLNRMLKINPEERIGIEEVCQDDWLTGV